MTKAEIRAQQERVERALRYIQRRLGLNLDFTVTPRREISLMDIQPSERGVEDPKCFLIGFNPDMVSAMSLKEVRLSAFHEVLHAWMWPFWEAATANLQARVKDHVQRRFWEALVYDMERNLGKYVVR